MTMKSFSGSLEKCNKFLGANIIIINERLAHQICHTHTKVGEQICWTLGPILGAQDCS